MNSTSLRTAATYTVCAGAGACCVFLMTLMFSFLGTIFSALLGGMMLSAAKPSKGWLIPTSFIFPAVIFSVLRPGRTDLLPRQVVLVSLLCFGAFWLTYGVMSAVMASEREAAGG